MRLNRMIAIGALAACTGIAAADSLDLEPPQGADPRPDISTGFIVGHYNGSTLDLTGFAIEMRSGAVRTDLFDSFNISASVDQSGVFTGGTLTIGGYLTADIVAFCPHADGAEFLSVVTGGSLASEFGGVGGQVGTVYTAFGQDDQLPPLDEFVVDWKSFAGVADTFAVNGVIPVPTSAALAVAGFGIVGARRRR